MSDSVKENNISVISSRPIALRANSNGKFVSDENNGNESLAANCTNLSVWGTFQLVYLGEQSVALKLHAGERYECTENVGQDALIANRTEFYCWETFKIVDRGNGKVSLIAVNGKYVCADC